MTESEEVSTTTYFEDIQGFRRYAAWPGRPVSVFSNPSPSESLKELVSFGELLQSRFDSVEPDPQWFVTNIYGSRGGHGSVDLMKGISVDPRSNPAHRYAIQYLEDQELLDRISNNQGDKDGYYDSIVTSVSWMHPSQDAFNKSCMNFCQASRIAFISLSDGSKLCSGGIDFSPTSIGETTVIRVDDSTAAFVTNLRCVSGSYICVVFGEPNSKARLSHGPLTSTKIELSSLQYQAVTTTARRIEQKYITKISCPDCRRPICIKTAKPDYKSHAKELPVLVSYAADVEEVNMARDHPVPMSTEFSERIILIAKGLPIDEGLKNAWTRIIPCRTVTKWNQKRGIHDHTVPDTHVSPALFPRGSPSPLKDNAYSIISAIGHPEFEGKLIHLVNPGQSRGVSVRASSSLYKKMKCELHDWAHPCHTGRSSALDFVKEWVRAFPDIAI